jgi:CRP/FNR family cyclic AMP-dependent transcriptional regulator
LSQQNIYQFFKTANRRRFYPKGSIIILQGSSINEVYFIVSGLVRIYSIDKLGNQHTVALFSENHVMPISWLLTDPGKDGALFFYQAITDTSCYSMLRDEVRHYMRGNIDSCFLLLDVLAKSYLNSAARIQTLQRSNASEKIDFVLYYVAQLYGRNISGNELVELKAPITHQEIADLAGLTRESISRQLTKLKYHSVLYLINGKTFIDLSKLDVQSMPKVYSLKV